MGFRTGAYATVWEITPKTDGFTQIRISTSKKNKETGEYETDFSGFVAVFGRPAAGQAAKLKERDRIVLGDLDVTTTYVKDTGKNYTNYAMYSFKMASQNNNNQFDNTHSVADPEPVIGNEPEEDDTALPW